MEAESKPAEAKKRFAPRTPVRVTTCDRFAGRTGVVSEASVAIPNLIVVEMDQVDDEDVSGVKVFMAEELEQLEAGGGGVLDG